MTTINNRPVFLDLLRIKLPVAGVLSILHRASGLLLFLTIPAFIYLLEHSLQDPSGFQQTLTWLQAGWAWPLLFLFMWALLHHLLAGIRFLLLDVHIGIHKPVYRYTAWLSMLAAPLLALLLMMVLL